MKKNTKVEIRQSGINGKGLFATLDIKKGELIGYVKGDIKFQLNKNKNKKVSVANPNWVGLSENTWIDTLKPFVFINHSCNPSAGIKGRVSVCALRNIKVGEEVTIDYAITEVDILWEMTCNCNEKNCRKVITSIQSLPHKTFQKYLPYIPTCFQRIYLRNYLQKK